MKAYKASYRGKCKTLKYEVGKTYTFEGKLEICEQGFHFCKNPKDVLDYYPHIKNLVLFEIEVLGDVIDEGDNSVTNKLKVIRIVPPNEYPDLLDIILDDNGNRIYNKNSNGIEEWREYDENGNLIYYKNSDGYESWQKFDNNGNVIHYKNSDGYDQWYEYDDNGNLISHKKSTGNNWKITTTNE